MKQSSIIILQGYQGPQGVSNLSADVWLGESCSHIMSPGRLARCTLYGARPWFLHHLTPFAGGTLRTESKRFFSISSAEKMFSKMIPVCPAPVRATLRIPVTGLFRQMSVYPALRDCPTVSRWKTSWKMMTLALNVVGQGMAWGNHLQSRSQVRYYLDILWYI